MTMTSIIPKPMWLLPLAALAILGAGCFSPDAPAAVPPTPTPTPAPSPTPAPTPVPTPTPAPSPSGYVLPTIDATWLTYTNKALGFSFQYPTKGRYVPQWENGIVSEKDAKIQNGCYYDEQTEAGSGRLLTVNGREFCRTSGVGAAAGSRYFVYHFATKFGTSYALISFTKQAVVGDNFDDVACHGKLVLSSGGCIEFVQTDFEAQLDQIMGTFRTTE